MQPDQLPANMRGFLNPAIYPHPVNEVLCHETHISWVFLAGEFAYKIKKAVDLGFVDFTTLERRKKFCEAEIRLNSRLASELYLHVTGISGSPENPSLEGNGEIWEYAVCMRRFPDKALLSQQECQAQLTIGHWKTFARQIARFHREIRVAPPETSWGSAPAVLEVVTDNFSPIRSVESSAPVLTQIEEIEHWVNQQYAVLAPRLEARKSQGLIRECHGDLHLQNLVLYRDQITAFDGIEFNEAFRWIDPLNEIAFLTMDLLDRGLSAFAAVFLSEYLQQTGDYAGLELLNFYQVYRALVRAKVNALRSGQLSVSAEKSEAIKELRRYIELAWQFARPPRPRLVLTVGVSGTGKSTIAQQIVEQAGAMWLRSDLERKRMYGEWPSLLSLPKTPPHETYSPEGIAAVYQRLRELAGRVLAAGFSVVVDATFLKREQRELFLKLAETEHIPATLLFLDAEDEELLQRIEKRSEQSDNLSDANAEVLELQRREWEPFSDEEMAHVFVAKLPFTGIELFRS